MPSCFKRQNLPQKKNGNLTLHQKQTAVACRLTKTLHPPAAERECAVVCAILSFIIFYLSVFFEEEEKKVAERRNLTFDL